MRYEFLNTKTDEIEEHVMSWKELDQFKEDNPHLKKVITAPMIVSSVGHDSGIKPGGGLDEVFSKAAEAHPDSPLADRYGKKSIKEIKTKEVINKHRKKWTKE